MVTSAMRCASQSRRIGPAPSASHEPARQQAGGAQGRHRPGEEQERVSTSPTTPKSAIVCATQPCAWRVTDCRCGGAACHREPARADALDGPRLEDLPRLAPVLAARRGRREHAFAALLRRHLRLARELADPVADAAVAERHRGERGERDQARHATATMPTLRRTRADGTRRAELASTTAPASISTASIRRTSVPKSPATASFADSGWSALVNGSFDSAHALTPTAATSGNTSTGRLRSRSGTSTNQTIAPIAAAAAAPRDCVSAIATKHAPISG